jgi:hypothetical protein
MSTFIYVVSASDVIIMSIILAIIFTLWSVAFMYFFTERDKGL